MDKHERPYRCQDPACAKLQGFTYSGGLLRHEREVHKKHGGPRKPLMCPYASCKRSKGAGFTRKENLDEHKRRCHNMNAASGEEGAAAIRRSSAGTAGLDDTESEKGGGIDETGQKRKRSSV